MDTLRVFYRRHLPHYQPPGATLFITFRLAGSLPKPVMERLQREAEQLGAVLQEISDARERSRRAYVEQRKAFGRWDAALDTARQGAMWLKQSPIAQCVMDALHYRDGTVYELFAFCIMSNHVHMVCKPRQEQGNYYAIEKILQSMKGYTAWQANQILGRKGTFWQQESYDHVVRDDGELQRILYYVINNPVKVGLVRHWTEWPWNYCRSDLQERFGL